VKRSAWRNGKLCLSSPLRLFPTSAGRDPIGDADLRLRWHVERALDWIAAAAIGKLVEVGDLYELPQRPCARLPGWSALRVVHDESGSSFGAWQQQVNASGTVVLARLDALPNVLVVATFLDRSGVEVRAWAGRKLEKSAESLRAHWWLWPRTIVLDPWHVPGTWGELRRAGRLVGIDVDARLKQLVPRLRGAKERTILFLGYPIPKRIGGDPVEVHWDAILLPEVAPVSAIPPRGFRPNANGWWHRDRHTVFADAAPLEYLTVENWHSERLQARGRLPAPLCDAKIAIFGVGALGSMIAEHLVRAGVRFMRLFDKQLVVAGNLTRHVTTLADVGSNKASAVAARLLRVSPTVSVQAFEFDLDGGSEMIVEALDECDIVIDCTASDEALAGVAAAWWSTPRLFASFALGAKARRLYSFGVVGHSFPLAKFVTTLDPWLREDGGKQTSTDELREGPGCWSPLFPARYDDVSLAAAVCIKEIETLVAKRPSDVRFRVFERQDNDDEFTGFAARNSGPLKETTTP